MDGDSGLIVAGGSSSGSGDAGDSASIKVLLLCFFSWMRASYWALSRHKSSNMLGVLEL